VNQSQPIQSQAQTRQAAAQIGSATMYEVVTAAGKSTGRKFSSLVAATGFATRIGGSTRPAD
jgi:predicted alpha/beta-hydrolase family hydrolase